ncbi:DUF3089 domain-containing protein [Caulobacter segnis]|uniref:DUF3089 domain-containing protein n=2 Tax=Caulobacter segnis TaxID=88688 RepID=D5VJH9_CAUST|nr:DUF3089 domain-containing protein [Caulobacter segnis]ADG10388.1 conserved hypothetical protein [Caulobacter segnis ATCC 21756]AVQ02118.1 DUF3089 domain-containing protein [Caulobacter segnis]
MALKGFKRWIFAGVVLILALILSAAFFWRYDILSNALDPKVPFLTYRPPPAPDYGKRESWALLPRNAEAAPPADRPVDIFFVHPTTFDGGRDWNGGIDEPKAARFLTRVVLPNYAGPFDRVGRIFAPRYRQASLYTYLTLRDDAREARRFAYGDVLQAFRAYRVRYGQDRPFIVVGVEQGGSLAARLLNEEIAAKPELKRRLVAAYLVETPVPADEYAPGAPLPACDRKAQTGCVAAWISAPEGDFQRVQELIGRSLIWDPSDQLVNLEGRTPLCFNPLLGGTSPERAPARLNLGATNATGLDWGARPPFLQRQVSARCENGILRTSRPKSSSLRDSGSWADRRKVDAFNLFYADLEADALARGKAATGQASVAGQ